MLLSGIFHLACCVRKDIVMATIEKSIEINVPVGTAYNQWTQFEEFPRFMEGVREVRQLDDTHLQWRAEIGRQEEQWTSEILNQVPDQSISWRSTSGAPNAGEVRFEPLDDFKCRVFLRIDYDPQGVKENVADLLGIISRRIEGDLKRFKDFIESRGVATGGWRGQVQGGRKAA